MKYLLIALAGAVVLGAGLSACAVQEPNKVCPPRALVLPLDHGPRAQTTPYLNQVRKARYEAEVKACKDAPKETSTS